VQERGQIPPVDYEFRSLLLGDHNYRANANTPRQSSVSTGSALLLGWTTPSNAACVGCVASNQEDVLTLSMLQNNTLTAGVAESIIVNSGVDNPVGIWGVNVSISNGGHSTATMSSGIFGTEINIGLDSHAVDTPFPGVGQQSLGLAVTESSVAAGHRVSAALAVGSSGFENFHNGLYIGAAPTGAHAMDNGIYMSGPITAPIDLRLVTGQTVGDIRLGSGINHSISYNDGGGTPRQVLFGSGYATILRTLGGSTVFQSLTGVTLGSFQDAGGFQPTPQTLAQLGSQVNLVAGFIWFCSDCTPATSPCTGGGTGAVAVRENGAFKCL
jgi:hypothetical protein